MKQPVASSPPLPLSPPPTSKTPAPPPTTLQTTLRNALQKRELRSSRRRLTTLPPTAIDFSSNDFLSLSTSPLYRTRFLNHLTSAPPHHPFASGGSRLLDGNSPYAESLESQIATFHRAPTGLLFNSGFDANIGVLACLPQPGDVIVHDELVHASAREGMRLSRAAKRLPFAHSDPTSLERVLLHDLDESVRDDAARNVFVVVESLYSMDGDIAPLRAFVDVVDRVLPRGNAYFVVDEAHATGVLGPRGAGVVQELGLEERMFVRVHTFGKALASHGAIVLCCPDTREYLVNYARSLIYTTALGFPFLAAIRTAYELLSEGETEPAQHTLRHLTSYLHNRLHELTTSVETSVLAVDHFPGSPVFALRTPVPRRLAEACQREGIIVRAIMAPTVPAGRERVRVCLHAGNTMGEIDLLVGVIQRWVGERARL